MRKNLVTIMLVLGATAGACLAEDAAALKFYRVDFVVKEVDGGKVVNARSYSATVSTKPNTTCHIRTNSRIPFATNMEGSSYATTNAGTNIDCGNVLDLQNGLSMTVTAEVESIAQDSSANTVAARQPIVRTNKWDSTLVVPLKKPTVVFSSDDVTSKHQMQLEITATPIP